MVRPGSTILIPFNAFDSNDPSASVIVSDFVLADIGIYKGLSMDERGSTTGVVLLDTDGINIDGALGVHGFSIDLSSNATAAFYSAGSHYYVTVGPITIDAATVNFVAATFSIGYPDAIINTTIASVTDQTQFILTDGPAEADVLIGCPILFHDVASAVQLSIGYITDYIVTTKEVFIAADPGGFTFVATDNVSIFMPANVRGVGGTLQTAGDLAALITTVDGVVDAIQTVTDKFAFTVANHVDSNALLVEGADATDTITASCDASLDTAIAELSQGVPTATPTTRTALMLMYMALRNKLDVATSGTDTLEVHSDDGTRIAQKLLTDDGSDYSEAKMTSGA
jgi:hypothetical protein